MAPIRKASREIRIRQEVAAAADSQFLGSDRACRDIGRRNSIGCDLGSRDRTVNDQIARIAALSRK